MFWKLRGIHALKDRGESIEAKLCTDSFGSTIAVEDTTSSVLSSSSLTSKEWDCLPTVISVLSLCSSSLLPFDNWKPPEPLQASVSNADLRGLHPIQPWTWNSVARSKTLPVVRIYLFAHTWVHSLWMNLLMILGNKRNPNGSRSIIKYKTKQN